MSEEIEKLSVTLALEANNFTKQISAINKEIGNLDREFKTAAQGNKQFENSFTGLGAKMQKLTKQIDLYNKKLESQKNQYKSLQSTLTTQKAKLDSLESTLGKNSNEWKKQAQLVQKNAEKLSRLGSNINQTKSTISRLRTELTQTGQKFQELGNKTLTIDQKLNRLNSQARLTESEFNRLGAELAQSGSYFQRLGNEMNQLGSKIQSNKARLAIYQAEFNKLNNELNQNKQKHAQLGAEIRKTESILSQVAAYYGKNSHEAQQLTQKLYRLKDAYNKQEIEIKQAETALNGYQAEINQTSANITRLSAQLRQMPFTTLSRSLLTAGQNLKSIGMSLGMYVSMPLGMLGVAATKAGVNFDTSMSKLQATAGIADKSSVSFQKLQEKAQDLGARTSFSAAQAADGLTYLALAGWDVETSLSRIEPVLRAAEAGNMDLALCSDLVTDSMSSAGIASQDFTKYLDITAQAQRKSNTSMQQMLEAYVTAGGMFKNLNMPLEQSAALIGILANRGTKASEAGNALISVFSNIIGENGRAGKALDALGISLYNSNGKQKDTIAVLKEMSSALGVTSDSTTKLTEEERARFATMIGGKTQYDTLMKLLAGVNDEYDELEESLKNSKGALMEVATTMKDNLGGAITNMKSALEGAGIKAFKAMEPVLASLIQKITELANWFTNLSESSQQNIVKMAAIAVALAPVLMIFGQLIIVSSHLTNLMGNIKKATRILGASGFGGLAAKVGALIPKLFSLQGAFALLAAGGIVLATKALHDYSVADGKAYEQRKKNIESLEREKKGYEESRQKIGYIAQEYDKLKGKSKLSSEEAERLKTLTKEIAEIMPELVSGYDEEGNPILKMKGSATELCSELDRAIEKKERLINFDKMDNAEIAVDKQSGKRGKDGNKLTGKAADSYQTDSEKIKTIQKKYNDDIAKLEKDGVILRGKIRNSEGKDREKYIQKYNEHLRKREKLTQDAQKENERSLEEAKKVAQEVEEGVFATVKSSSSFKSSKNNDAKKQFDELKGFLDFSEIKTKEQLSNAENAMNKLFKSASAGKINLSDVKKEIEGANDALAKDGNLNSYNKKMQNLAKTIADKTGTQSSDWISLLTTLDKEFLKTSDSTDVFLKKFNRTRQQLESGDSLAVAVQQQYEALNAALEGLQITGKEEVDIQTVIDFTNDQNIPEDVRNFVNSLIKKDKNGNITNSEEVIKFTADLLFELQQENPNFNNLQAEADKLFGKNKVKVTKDLEITEGEIDTSNVKTDDVEQKIKDKFAQDKVSAKINVAIENGDINSDKIKLVEEIFDKIPTEYKTKFILDNTEAINKAKNYDDIIKYLKDNPEIAQKYNIKVEGLEKTKEINEETNKINKKKAEPEVKVKNADESKKELEDVGKEADKVDKKKPEPEVKVKNADESKKELEDVGKETDKIDKKKAEPEITTKGVEGTAEQLNQLANKAKEIEKGEYEISITAKTAQAAKNVSGLITKINQFSKVKVKQLVFKTETAQAAKNVTGLDKKVANYKKKYGGKTITTTFKAETAQAARNISGLMRKIDSYKANYARSFTTSMTANVQVNKNVTTTEKTEKNETGKPASLPIEKAIPAPALLNDSPTPTTRENIIPRARGFTSSTPIAVTGKDIADALKYDVNLLQELENRLQKINNELTRLDKLSENATDADKIKYLQKQNELYKEQAEVQKDLEDKLIRQKNYYESALKEKGLKFNKDGNSINYEEEILKKKKIVADLEEKAEKAKDKNKDSLQKKAEKEKNSLEEIQKLYDEYIKVTLTSLPECVEQWNELNQKIKENEQSIKNIKREQEKLFIESTWTSMYKDVQQVKNELDMLDVKLKNASTEEKEEIIKKKIELQKKYNKELTETTEYMKQVQNQLKGKLQKLGFEFRDNGDISNYIQQIQKLKEENKDFEEAEELAKGYLDLLLEKIPSAQRELEGITGAIADLKEEQKKLYEEQLNTITDVEKEITDIYKKQVEERKKLIDEELKKRTDALNKEKKAYNDAREEMNYKNDEKEQKDAIAEIEKELEIARKNTSLFGQKRVQDLEKKLKEEQKKLEKLVQDNLDKQVNNMFDKESERLENEAEETVKNLEEKFSDTKLAEIVKEVLNSGIFTDIDGNVKNLQDTMIEFINKYQDGLTIAGDKIKTEWLDKLDEALDKMEDLAEINEKLGVKEFNTNLKSLDYNSQRYSQPTSRMLNNNTTNNNQFIFNPSKPLVVVENATKDSIPDLQRIIDKSIKEAINDFAKEIVK
ncbi:TPA: phage tail tape measure protein [Clostridioides difficile]|uniref:phage tail tape measure protein n=1 Tax=Clostridioides difficile TaxID=1496 RepID=UPI00038CD4AF|nr:phage tail tape measure protein [Clostridioides difficile]EQG92225.1 phage tail tape measure protein, TP901 family, core region [Clostridioides difficile DA00191]HBF6011798.1 phage tail tape measure protein [Clostridioides difficile]HBF7200958.1 phage tail tape measure protein [Clostridioides difficile]